MNFISANTTNHRRAIMAVATMLFSVFMNVAVYQSPLTVWEIVFPPIVGLAVFELIFRARKWLTLRTLVVYIVIVLLASTMMYGILYSISYGSYWNPILDFTFLFTEIRYALYALFDATVMTSLGYYLVKIYRREEWETGDNPALTEPSNQPIGLFDQVSESSDFFVKYRQQIQGFIGWFVLATVFVPWSFGLITTPATIICLLVFGFSRTRKGIAGGILVAVSLNFFLALARGTQLNAWCFMPFYYTGF